jgi:hypothetical protein
MNTAFNAAPVEIRQLVDVPALNVGDDVKNETSTKGPWWNVFWGF